MAQPVELVVSDDGIGVLAMQHGKVNAIDLELLAALDAALETARAEGARGLVLSGSGSCFSAGVDLRRVLDGGATYLQTFLPRLRDTFQRLAECPLPLVAAVNGHAIAGGFIFLAAADRAILADGPARLGTTELLVGVPFPTIAFELVRLRAGDVQAAELILEGTTFTAEQALAKHLVDEVVAPAALDQRARAVARRLADLGPAFGLSKQQLRQGLRERCRDAHVWDEQVEAIWRAPATPDRIRTYVAATLGRREPAAG
jgi:enoyl-CoA hydratase